MYEYEKSPGELLTFISLMGAWNSCSNASTDNYSCVLVVGFNVHLFNMKKYLYTYSVPSCVPYMGMNRSPLPRFQGEAPLPFLGDKIYDNFIIQIHHKKLSNRYPFLPLYDKLPFVVLQDFLWKISFPKNHTSSIVHHMKEWTVISYPKSMVVYPYYMVDNGGHILRGIESPPQLCEQFCSYFRIQKLVIEFLNAKRWAKQLKNDWIHF